MIEGAVNSRYEAVITLALRGPSGQIREVEAVVDTGFTDFLILPPSLVAELGLPLQGNVEATMANGSVETFETYDVTVIWDGQPRSVDTYEADVTPLAGMLLLDRHSLYVEVEPGGRVVIQPPL